MNEMGSIASFKIVLLGEGRVGKTSIALRFVCGTYSDKQQATVQAAFLSKQLKMNGKRIELAIWDTAGQERFHALGPLYYRDADAALLVYDIMDSETFDRVKLWVKELHRMAPPGIILAIVANKIDLDPANKMDLNLAKKFADSMDAPFFTSSAKMGTGIDDIFANLSQKLYEKKYGSKIKMSEVFGDVNLTEDESKTISLNNTLNESSSSKCC